MRADNTPATRYFVLDTETSGLPPDAGVCEIGWIETDACLNIVGEVESLIDPERPITPAASGVHGITDEDVADKPTLQEFFTLQQPPCHGQPLSAERIVLVGHKVAFDYQFVAPYLQGEVLQVCTLRWARHLWPFCDDHKLATLRYALGLRRDTGNAHRVMADILLTFDLLRLILETTQCNLDELAERSQQPMLLHRMPFGKHKDLPFEQVPVSYLKWMRDNIEEMDIDLAFTVAHWLNK